MFNVRMYDEYIVRMYADDTNLIYASKDPDELFLFLTRELGNLQKLINNS